MTLLGLLFAILLTVCGTLTGPAREGQSIQKPGIRDVQTPFASLQPTVTFKIGGTADWVLVTEDAVWVTGTKPYSLRRVDPQSNSMVAKVPLPGEACSGIELGFKSVWVPICGTHASLVKISAVTNQITATLPIAPGGAEGGIAVSDDGVWMITDRKGTLVKIDPTTNNVRQTVSVSAGSYNPVSAYGTIWVTGYETNLVTAVDASSGKVLATIPVGPKPRFITSGAGSVWSLNQGDGTVSRIDGKSKTITATIEAGIPGEGGDICFGKDSVWASVFDVPLTRIDPTTNRISRQWIGKGGDSLRFGHDSIWLTDYRRGLLWRIPSNQLSVPQAEQRP